LGRDDVSGRKQGKPGKRQLAGREGVSPEPERLRRFVGDEAGGEEPTAADRASRMATGSLNTSQPPPGSGDRRIA
jgi:hypothetical protein